MDIETVFQVITAGVVAIALVASVTTCEREHLKALEETKQAHIEAGHCEYGLNVWLPCRQEAQEER